MKWQAIVGIVLILVGVAGLLALGSRWGWRDGTAWGWHQRLMMRGFGRQPMFGPGWGPGGRLGPEWGRRGPFGPGGQPGRRWGGGQMLPPVAGARTIDIVAAGSACQPAEVSVKSGEAVNIRLVNQGATPYGLVLPWQRVWLFAQPGQSVTSGLRTDQPGQYTFFCGAPGNPQARTTGLFTVTP